MALNAVRRLCLGFGTRFQGDSLLAGLTRWPTPVFKAIICLALFFKINSQYTTENIFAATKLYNFVIHLFSRRFHFIYFCNFLEQRIIKKIVIFNYAFNILKLKKYIFMYIYNYIIIHNMKQIQGKRFRLEGTHKYPH